MNLVSIISNLFFLLIGSLVLGLIITYVITLTKKKSKDNNLRYLGKDELIATHKPAEAIIQKSSTQANFVFKYDPKSQKYSSAELDSEIQRKKRITIVNTNVHSRISTNFN